jgi:4-azaleucine resistance transporter AzlC
VVVPSPASHGIAGEVRDGLRDILPAVVAAIPIGVLFGALCVAKGLSPLEVALMSALVCAGAAQFAAIELWGKPVPVAAIVFSTLLVNARHVLMGASLVPKTGAFTPLQRILGFYVLSDENWALSERRATSRPLTPVYFITMGSALYLNWVCCCTLGAFAGALFGDPRRLGADFAFTALFIGLIAGFWRGRSTAATITASAVAAALAYVLVGPPWHVGVGALAGIMTAYFSADRKPL